MRNELRWDGKACTVTDVCHCAAGMAMAFLEVDGEEVHDTNEGVGSRGTTVWRPPLHGSYKVFSAYDWVGVGILVRDHNGNVAATLGFVLQRFNERLLSYSCAALSALEFPYVIGFHNIELEYPSKELIGLILQGSPSMPYARVLVDDICGWSSMFYQLRFSFINNDCNKASNALATKTAFSNLD